jgi:hypothetical protein
VLIEDDGERGRVSFEFYSEKDRARLLHLLVTAGRALDGKSAEVGVGA